MKRFYSTIALALCLALMFSAYLPDAARAGSEPFLGVYRPDVAQTGGTAIAGSEQIQKLIELDATLDGEPVRVEFSFALAAEPKDAVWTELAGRLTQSAAARVTYATGQTAGQIGQAIRDVVDAMLDEDAQASLGGAIALTSVKVTLPYYADLTRGASGDAVTRLQQRLIQLGFLEGTADGQFGGGTEAGVLALENYIRALEQAEIDANATPTPAPTPEPTPAPTPDPSATDAADADAPEIEATPEPTPEPAPTPQTPADGVAEAALQAFLMADDFPIAQGDLKRGDQGDAVLRFQRSLSAMGVLLDLPDSFYGANTQRSVRLVQWANDLPQTGVADVALQQLVFSGKAKPLPGALLTQGSSGDEVKKLQQRLHALGFLIGTPDGSFGAATATAVQNLQTYFQAQERAALQAQATHNAAGADRTAAPSAPKPGATALPTATAEPAIDETLLTTVVNGVADPLLLERFYAADFPDVPADMQSGASGEEVKRVQRRLYDLEYLFSSADGAYGAGTATAITEFQKRNKLSQTGAADAATLKVLFSDDAKKALKPYVLKISIAKQRVYAYAPDESGEYTKLVRTMKCSTGRDSTPTPKGTYQASTGTGARWHYFKKFDVWAQYAYYIQGDYMIHSVLYPSKNGRATSGSVGALGRKASHGCVRLSVEDAKWVYNNCPNKTKIIVY